MPALPGADLEHLGIERGDDRRQRLPFILSPLPASTAPFPTMLEEVKKQIAEQQRVLIAVPNTGEVERLADMFTEYNVSFRLGSRTRSGESYADETAYFAGEVLTATLVKAYVPDGVILPDAHLSIFGARDLFDESEAVAHAVRNGRSRRHPHSFPTSATCRWATTSSTSSTASASIRA